MQNRHERRLTRDEARDAASIQVTIDELAHAGGGRLVLPAMEIELDRGLELRSGIELAGQGTRTVLRKGPGRIYPLTGYHNYGMHDVPVADPTGLRVGMTVSVLDDLRRGFYSTFARISWIDGHWVGLDRGISADYLADANPRLTTAHPLIFGHDVSRVAIRNLAIEGAKAANPAPMDACRGGAIYFARSREILVADVTEHDYHGDGLSFQMCRQVRVLRSAFSGNTGNGLHPGAGSTAATFDACRARENDGSGLFFCVRANHMTVRHGDFRMNGVGVSFGTRDCVNVLDTCTIQENRGCGILARECPLPVAAHSVVVKHCSIVNNGGPAQVLLYPATHDWLFHANRIARGTVGVRALPGVERLHFDGCRFDGCEVESELPEGCEVTGDHQFRAGHASVGEDDFRHL